MEGTRSLQRVLLFFTLALTGVWCEKSTVFVYSRLGGDTVLPCRNLMSTNCSLISWTFYRGGGVVHYSNEVIRGQVRVDSDKSGRVSVTSGCALRFSELRVDDVGSYVCLQNGNSITNVYLSLLAIAPLSTITDLQPGGNLILSCILYTYYDVGSCKPYSREFSLSWVMEDGTELPRDTRYELIDNSRCNITLVTKLQEDDNNRKWRCHVNSTENGAAVFQDFTSAFLFQNPSTDPDRSPSVNCGMQLPISRIVLCVALPIMVITVGCIMWREERKTSAAGLQLQEIS